MKKRVLFDSALPTGSIILALSLSWVSSGWAVEVSPTTTKPAIVMLGTGCPDGLCIWIKGSNLLDGNVLPRDAASKHLKTYINIYNPANGERILKRYAYQFTLYKVVDGLDVIALPINHAGTETIFQNRGLEIQVVNPEISNWTDRVAIDWVRNPIAFKYGFQGLPSGLYSVSDFDPIWRPNPSLGWRNAHTLDYSYIYSSTTLPFESSRVLTMKLLAGRYGPPRSNGIGGAGTAWTTVFCQRSDCRGRRFTYDTGYEELYVSYWIRFASCGGAPFDWARGGKMPGLGGGALNVATGGGADGVHPDGMNGWSARAMFKADGQAAQYVYHPDMFNENPYYPRPNNPDSWKYGQNFPWTNPDGTPHRFATDAWYRLQMRVKMNSLGATEGNFDGEIEVKVNQTKVLFLDRMRFRHPVDGVYSPLDAPYHVGKTLDIDSILFGVFHGGGTIDWAPDVDSCVQIDDVILFGRHK